MDSFTIKFLRSREYCWAIGAILFIVLPLPAFYWFNYYRIGDFEMRWTTGEQAGFRSRGPDFDAYGNPKVLILWPVHGYIAVREVTRKIHLFAEREQVNGPYHPAASLQLWLNIRCHSFESR